MTAATQELNEIAGIFDNGLPYFLPEHYLQDLGLGKKQGVSLYAGGMNYESSSAQASEEAYAEGIAILEDEEGGPAQSEESFGGETSSGDSDSEASRSSWRRLDSDAVCESVSDPSCQSCCETKVMSVSRSSIMTDSPR